MSSLGLQLRGVVRVAAALSRDGRVIESIPSDALHDFELAEVV
jgi:hypothetical protein